LFAASPPSIYLILAGKIAGIVQSAD